MSLVGGLIPKPNIPMRLEMPSSNSTVPRYAKYGLPALPMLPSKKLFTHVTADSSIACPRPGTIFRLRVKSRTAIMMNAIMPHMTTMDSCTGIPPNSGMVKATSVCSSSANASPIFSPSSLTSSFAVPCKRHLPSWYQRQHLKCWMLEQCRLLLCFLLYTRLCKIASIKMRQNDGYGTIFRKLLLFASFQKYRKSFAFSFSTFNHYRTFGEKSQRFQT